MNNPIVKIADKTVELVPTTFGTGSTGYAPADYRQFRISLPESQHGQPLQINFAGDEMTLQPRTFQRGSQGYYFSDRVEGKTGRFMRQFKLVRCGSKPRKDGTNVPTNEYWTTVQLVRIGSRTAPAKAKPAPAAPAKAKPAPAKAKPVRSVLAMLTPKQLAALSPDAVAKLAAMSL